MSKPIVAVVGRPDVGKSTFFNQIIGKRISIVDDTPGVTRDRIYAETEWNGVSFGLIDTGGIEPKSDDEILFGMRQQAEIAIDMADLVLFMVDVREGMTQDDHEVADMLRRTGKKVILVANKADDMIKLPDNFYDFYELGIGEPIPVSSVNKLNFGDLMDEIVHMLPACNEAYEEEKTKIAIVGKPNAGKSSLVNELLQENRVLVSSVAGTTRDSIDTNLKWGDKEFVLIDTAGIRRQSKVDKGIERFSVIRAIASIERCDVTVIMIDASEGLTEQDKRIVGLAHDAGKGIVITVNKWDLLKKETNTARDFTALIRSELGFASYAPIIYISVKNRLRIGQVITEAEKVANIRRFRVPTGQLNSLIADAMMMRQPPADKGKRLKIYFGTQVGIEPPLFSFQVNKRSLVHFSYSRYLENRIRDAFGFEGTSIKFVFREKREKDQND